MIFKHRPKNTGAPAAVFLIIFALVEALLAFYGPIRLTRTPTLMIAPFTYTPRELNEQNRELLVAGIESAFASAGNSSVKPPVSDPRVSCPHGPQSGRCR